MSHEPRLELWPESKYERLSAWALAGGPLMLIARTIEHSDPVELTIEDAREVGRFLLEAADWAEANEA